AVPVDFGNPACNGVRVGMYGDVEGPAGAGRASGLLPGGSNERCEYRHRADRGPDRAINAGRLKRGGPCDNRPSGAALRVQIRRGSGRLHPMCGIAGYVLSRGRAELDIVRSMCDQIRHRGPDDSGYHVDGPCALGMRRLSIIDLHTGHQPIANEDQSLWVVYNGEVYNYQELRRDLIAKGHRFRTESDTETLLHLYEEEGVAGLSKLRGMFAFALWDARRGELLLVRDRFGKKPLYYAHLPEGLFFGSELKCLRAAGIPLDIDQEALRLYFQFTYIPDPWSPYRQVRKLPPGSWLLYHADGRVEQGS